MKFKHVSVLSNLCETSANIITPPNCKTVI